jgi:hypothetical protein
MPTKTPTSNYLAMCNKLSASVNFLAKSPVPSPAGSPFESGKLIDVVQTNAAAMPVDYRTIYAQALVAALPSICAQLESDYNQAVSKGQPRDEAKADAVSTADTLVGAVRDWGNPTYLQPLQRFEAVVSNFYRSFLGDEQRSKIQLPLKEVMPPLATFAATGDAGPFTLPVDAITSLVHAPIGIVSLPGSYRDHPLLWPALAHETGGHDVVHADSGLEEELAKGVRDLKGLPAGVGSLWSAWMDETVADVYGLLNVGPSFALSLSAFFSSLEKAFGESSTPGVISNRLPVQNGSLADVHPVDLLRLYLAQGVVGKLSALAPATSHAWQTLIGEVATQAAGGKNTIDLFDIESKTVVQSLPLAPMADAARAVGAYIVTARLQALQGHCIQDIETWDDGDEDAANAIAAALAANHSIVALGDDAQLLAGATVAFYKKPADYDAITKALNAALDDSFARDPVFGKPSPHFMLPPRGTRATGRSYHRTLRSLASLGL